MNSLNLRQIDGGNIIKQADSGSLFKFELLDENHKKFEEQLGDTATVILKKDTVAVFKKIVAVVDNCVTFNLDKILEVGDYILEIIVGSYVFPSNNRLKISVESTYGDYQPENLVRITYEEIDEKINALTDRLEEFNVAGQTEMMNRIVALEKKEDKDTVYDDTKIKNSIDSLKSTVEQNEVNVNQELLGIGQKQAKMNDRLDALESKEDSDTIYDDSELVSRVTALENKPDKDTIYNDAQLKEELSETKSKVDSLSEKVSSLESKQDKDTIYDDSEIKRRITALEQKEDKDTIYNDTEIKQSVADVDTKVDNLSEKVTALEERPIVDTALTERVEALEKKPDKDTIYDDTAIKKELSELNQSIAKKKLYYAYAYEKDGTNGFTKSDVYDSFYCLVFNYFGISEKDSDNADDYIWMPTRVASDDKLSEATFEVNKLKDLHRKAPTGYTLDRTTIPWTVRFDNGCELRFPKNSPTSERDKANLIYGYGFPANNNSTVAFSAPIPPLIISASRGAFTVDKFKESDEAHFHVTYADYRLYYPIRKSDDFNWENAYGDRVNQTVSTNGKSNFAKLMYELGIWSEEDVLYLGATKK